VSQQINLYAPGLLPQRDVFSGAVILSALAGLTAMLLIVSAWASWTSARHSAQAQASKARLTELQTSVTQLSQTLANRKPSAQLAKELETLETQIAGRKEVMAVLQSGALGDTKGVSEYFRALARQRVDGLWLTGFTLMGAGSDITIEGKAISADLVPAYIVKLGKEQVLQGRGFATLNVQRARDDVNAGEDAKDPYLNFRMASRQGDSATSQKAAQ
jgi:hypothetical protein